MPHVIVVGALIHRNRVLLAHRSPRRRDFPDRWSLPGGHVEANEGAADALVRELKEELGIIATVSGCPSLHIERQPHSPEGMIQDVWVITAWEGQPSNLAVDEHDDLRWVSAKDLYHLELAHPEHLEFLVRALSSRSSRPESDL